MVAKIRRAACVATGAVAKKRLVAVAVARTFVEKRPFAIAATRTLEEVVDLALKCKSGEHELLRFYDQWMRMRMSCCCARFFEPDGHFRANWCSQRERFPGQHANDVNDAVGSAAPNNANCAVGSVCNGRVDPLPAD